MNNSEKCVICGSNGCEKKIKEQNNDGLVEKWEYNCEYCSKYIVDNGFDLIDNFTLIEFLENINIFENLQYYKNKIQSYIREQNDEFNSIPELTEEKIKQIINLPDKTIKEQFDLFIKNIDVMFGIHRFSNKFIYENKGLEILRIKSYILNRVFLRRIIEKAKAKNFIEVKYHQYDKTLITQILLTFDGIEYKESLLQLNQNSKKIFLAFKFNEENKIIFNNLADKIKELELNPVIVNHDTTNHNEKIGDRIISELKSSRILVADLTEHSPNVYYEIGYAMGMGIPVILTCKKEHIDNLAFDINQYPVFEWDNEEDLMKKVIDRIKVVL